MFLRIRVLIALVAGIMVIIMDMTMTIVMVFMVVIMVFHAVIILLTINMTNKVITIMNMMCSACWS